MGGKVRLQPLLRADLQQQAGGEVIAVSVGIRAESRIDVDELPTHHRQPVGVGQGAFIGQQQAMVVLRQTRVIGEHARIRQFEMHPVEVHVRRDDVGARMLHIRRQECDLAGLDMQGLLPHPHRQDAPTHEHQLEGVDGAPQMAPARSGHKLPDRVKVHRPFEPTCRDAHGYQSSR